MPIAQLHFWVWYPIATVSVFLVAAALALVSARRTKDSGLFMIAIGFLLLAAAIAAYESFSLIVERTLIVPQMAIAALKECAVWAPLLSGVCVMLGCFLIFKRRKNA
jgi:hypothetical protein